jgi:copper(I)-binding protein
MSLKSTLFGAIAAVSFALPAFADIVVDDQYARSSNAMAGAAFMVIKNTGDAPDHLLSATSDAAQRVELHTHIEDENGVMRMTHVEEGFMLPAGGEIVLQRGGKHVMFMGLNAPFEQGELVTVTLVFETAGEVTVEIPVDLERNDMMNGMNGDMDHSNMGDGTMNHGSDG